MDEFFDDVPDDVLDDDGLPDPSEIIADARSEEHFEVADVHQDVMLGYLARSSDVWVKSASAIKPSYFDPEYRPVVKFIQYYHRKHGQLPPDSIILVETGVRVHKPDVIDRKDAVEHILKTVDAFCRHKAVEEALQKSIDKFGDASRLTQADSIQISKLFEEASKVSIKKDLGINVFNDAKKYLEMDRDFGHIPTGIDFLDQAFGGGVNQPSFNIVSASSGQGKSIFLQNMAFNMALQNYNVVFYTLELEYPTIVTRFSAMMTNTDIALVTKEIHSVSHQMKQLGKHNGIIMVKKMKMGTTLTEIEAHYRDLCLETDEDFKVVCIDYIDVMKPADTNIKRDDIHTKDKDISEDMNNFFHSNDVIGWTASQQTKTAVEEKELKSSNVGGGKSKVDTSDNLIMLRRNEEEREDERTWAIIRKARSSGAVDSKIPLRWHARTQRMSDGDHDLFIKENPHLFGKKASEQAAKDSGYSEKVTNDPLAREQGIPEKKTKRPESKRTDEAVRTRNNLRKRISRGKTDG